MIARKRKPETDAPAPELEAAKARWSEVNTKYDGLLERREGMTLAQSLSFDEKNNQMPQHLRDRAKPYLRLAARRPLKLADELADVMDEIEEINPVFQAARDDWERAQRAETNRIAIGLQDKHRGAVREISEALELLSRAVAAECELHDELKRRAPKAESPNLPNMSGELIDFCLSERGSTAWRWRRRVHQLKILGG